jgi:nicotinate-nucleotide pyrophosphorylase (carboxylating)
MVAPLPSHIVEDAVRNALAEDSTGAGDITSLATIPADAVAHYELRARKSGVICGLQAAREAFQQCDRSIVFDARISDGDTVEAGDVVAAISGLARPILTAERIALNFLGRMSGIATLTAYYVAQIAETGAVIAHTRKTTPGLRAFEIQAVRAGGGAAHRYSLSDAVLIKDNHVAAAGGVGEAVRRAKAHAGHMTKVATEIDTLDQLAEALDAGAESILLDNFSLDDLRAAVAQTEGRAILEASGGVTLDTIRAIAETGVDVISVGAITHSATNFDLGLDAV